MKTLLALRLENDAVWLITERLGVQEMGPADHIRTKHEVKALVEKAGSVKGAEALIALTQKRHEIQHVQNITVKQSERQGHGQKM